jgi:hypothetical protein
VELQKGVHPKVKSQTRDLIIAGLMTERSDPSKFEEAPMTGLRNITLGAVLAGILASSLALPGTAYASSKGRKNTAIALGAIAVHQLLTGKTTNGLIAGAGAAYAYKRYEDARKDEKRRDRYYRYSRNWENSRYRRGRR